MIPEETAPEPVLGNLVLLPEPDLDAIAEDPQPPRAAEAPVPSVEPVPPVAALTLVHDIPDAIPEPVAEVLVPDVAPPPLPLVAPLFGQPSPEVDEVVYGYAAEPTDVDAGQPEPEDEPAAAVEAAPETRAEDAVAPAELAADRCPLPPIPEVPAFESAGFIGSEPVGM
jgi:hypothetical protein